MIVLVALAAWAAWWILPQTWSYSRLQWRLAPDLQRLSMADDYLAKHWREGMSLDELLRDLGRPTGTCDIWSYAASASGFGEAEPSAIPRHRREPILHAWFDLDLRLLAFRGSHLDEADAPQDFDAARWRSLRGADRRGLARSLVQGPPTWLVRAAREVIHRELGEPDATLRLLEYHVRYSGSDHDGLLFEVDWDGRVVRGGWL